MDTDGDGCVSLQEYTNFLCRTAGLDWVHPEMFRELDRNGDGQLDFWEVLTLYYVARTRTISCRACLQSLNGLYFTCVTCFDTPCGDTFDLCVKCFKQQSYSHPHRLFLDSYVLLRSRRSKHPLQPPGDHNLAQQDPSSHPPGVHNLNKEDPVMQPSDDHNLDEEDLDEEDEVDLWDAWEALEVVATVATACTIM